MLDLDVVALGDAMVSLSPKGYGRLEQAQAVVAGRRGRVPDGVPRVVVTMAAGGSLAFADGVLYRQCPLPRVTPLDPVGAGDAFAAGFLYGYLTGGVQRGLDWGGACGAIHCTLPGDFAYVNRAEVAEFLASGDPEIQR